MLTEGFSTAVADPALIALFAPFDTGELTLPSDGRVLFLNARDGTAARAHFGPHWLAEQPFKPFADALERAGLRVGTPHDEERFPWVLLLPPRQRQAARALFAHAMRYLAPQGIVVVSVPNAEGAKSAEADFAALAGPLRCVSRHKCRTFWTAPGAKPDVALTKAWLALDELREIAPGLCSRPGLFAWDRIDAASALLAAQLPSDLHGRVADLGAGYGYLATQVIARCPDVTAIDLYEADARALEPARRNLDHALRDSGRMVQTHAYWHDVTAGLPRRYDAIVSNPPFHQGRADLPQLGRAFIAAAADALRPHGGLWLVANRHLSYEATLTARFAEVRAVAVQGGFKVIAAHGART